MAASLVTTLTVLDELMDALLLTTTNITSTNNSSNNNVATAIATLASIIRPCFQSSTVHPIIFLMLMVVRSSIEPLCMAIYHPRTMREPHSSTMWYVCCGIWKPKGRLRKWNYSILWRVKSNIYMSHYGPDGHQLTIKYHGIILPL